MAIKNSIGKAATDAVYGRNYRQGPIWSTIYPASGSSVDYMCVFLALADLYCLFGSLAVLFYAGAAC